jgi:hypothetical protein
MGEDVKGPRSGEREKRLEINFPQMYGRSRRDGKDVLVSIRLEVLIID